MSRRRHPYQAAIGSAALLWIVGACVGAAVPEPTPPLVASSGELVRTGVSPRRLDLAPTAVAVVGSVFLVVMENKEYGQVIGQRDAPYINRLAAEYAVADQSYAITHQSLPDYLALLGGDTFGITSDCTTCRVDESNLVDALERRGKSWGAYMEDLPSPCFLGPAAADYALKHNPFLYFQNIRSNLVRCARVVPLTKLDGDLASGTVPDFVWISPNLRHDMHDGSVAEGDKWLATIVPRILADNAWQRNGLLIITWDEGASNLGCCTLAAGGRVPTLVIRPHGARGAHSSTPITHYSVLRTIEARWGLDVIGHSGDNGTPALLDIFSS